MLASIESTKLTTLYSFATNTYATNRLLWAVESISMQLGLRLNGGKCSYRNGNNAVRFAEGSRLQDSTVFDDVVKAETILEGCKLYYGLENLCLSSCRSKQNDLWCGNSAFNAEYT